MKEKWKIDTNMTIKKAAYINGLSKYSVVLLNLLFTSILARVLTPEDYGIVAVVTVFSTFFITLSDTGLAAAVIQNQDLTFEDEERIYTATLYLGGIFAVIFSGLSFVLVKIYRNDVYYSVGMLLSLYLCMSVFNIVPQANLLKNKRFGLVGIRTIISCILGFCVAYVVALLGGAYFAIVAQLITTSTFVFLWNIKNAKLKLRYQGMWGSVKKILDFTVFQSIFDFVTYFARNLDNLLVGYFIGGTALGLYNKSYQLMRYPVDNLSNLITPTLLPMLSEKQEDKQFILGQYNKIAKILVLLGVYISVFCFYASNEIIMILFGKQWEGAVGSFHWFSLGIVFQLIVAIRGSIYQIFGKTKKLSAVGIEESAVIIVAICIGIISGDIEKLSICYLIGFTIYFIHCQIYLAKDCFGVSADHIFKVFKRPTLMYIILFSCMNLCRLLKMF